MIAQLRKFVVSALTLALVIGISACNGSPTAPKPNPDPTPVEAPAQAFAVLVGTSPASPATRVALDILPDGTKVGDPSIKATIKFGLSKAQIDEIKSNGEKGIVQACLSADGVNAVKGACYLYWVEEGKTNDTVTASLAVAKPYEYVERTPHILFTIGRASQANPSKPRTVFSDGKFSFGVDFTWK